MKNVFTRVLIKDTDNHILVIKDLAGVWNFPGGKLELGEAPIECARREVREEIGVDVDALTEITQGDFYFRDIQWHGHFFLAESISGIPYIREVDKITDLQYIDRFESVNFPLELVEVIEDLFAKLEAGVI
ncbi:NUDIX hydrolase [Alkalihalobacterium sp. APHAB7]|uniref:NUDIX hydrolase n=1 Tax=Alkalihalobacterium sp. APHAB7 TaxID=3402081 RepID=UPI003AAB596B